MKFLWIGLVLLGAFLALSLWTFWLAVRPPRILIGGTPRDHGLPFEDVAITSRDGARLAAWFIPSGGTAADGRGTAEDGHAAAADGRVTSAAGAIVLLHGYPAEKADLLPIAAALHPRFATLLVDLRYFGASTGHVTTLGYREKDDLSRAVDALGQRGLHRIGVFGYSLGGAVALLAAADDRRIRTVVAYAPFSDLRVLAKDLYASLWLLKHPFSHLMRLWGAIFLGADITRPSPEMAAARLDIPVLLIHSRDDDQIPFAHAERLRAALSRNGRAEFQLSHGGHNDRDPDFERRVVDFFAKTLD
ncbi:MAG: hypothetical protein DMD81_08220 [Candidatus Rokuibacteriota bacterium]|nr:MAG: hypothetical protein DMD81_08220 [Candidatus Rokubacteria bacterium]